MKKLIPALCMLLVAAALLGTSTYAWFSMNTQVTATGMKVSATAVGSLVIKQDEAPAADYTSTTIQMTAADPRAILDATHDDSQIGEQATFKSGLKTLSSATRATILTTDGLYDGDDFVQVESTEAYFIDYVVYLAAKDAAIDDQDITATLSAATGTAFANAVAVDFYIGTPSNTTYQGTAHAVAATGNVVAFSTKGIDIPAADGAAGVIITMRVYIDGAVSSVYTNNYNSADISFDVTFSTTATTPAQG